LDFPGLPADLWPLLASCAPQGRLAVVGGAVRDALLHRLHRDPWRGLMDLDLVLDPAQPWQSDMEEPSPAQRFEACLSAAEMGGRAGVAVQAARHHVRFGTVEMELRIGGLELALDLATARCEIYPLAAANPQVCSGTLEQDLSRRDFTINAMAVLLPSMDLLDPHGGLADLERRELRFLHEDSLRDDPTRLVRAARYAARLGFGLAEPARRQVQCTLRAWPWSWHHGDPAEQAPAALATRLRMELELLLSRRRWQQALANLQGWGGLALLDPALQRDRHWCRRIRWAHRFSLPPLTALIAAAEDPPTLAERLQLPHAQVRLLRHGLELRQRLEALVPNEWQAWSPSRWTTFLEQDSGAAEAVALALCAGLSPRRPLLRWWLRWRHQTSPLTAAALISMGVKPGPDLGRSLRRLRLEAIDQWDRAGVPAAALPEGRSREGAL
jgi:poly(A) polymerase